MKRTIKFKDEDNNLIVADIEIKKNNKDVDVFTMSGDYKGSCGQCFDNVKPKNKPQRDLINFWKKHHLNNLHAGTKEQEEVLKNFKGDYDKQIKLLKENNLYEVTLKNGKKYKYGSGWLYNELPEKTEDYINKLCNDIGKIEQEEYNQDLTKEEQEELNELLEDDKIKALKEVLELEDTDILSIDNASYNNNIFSVNGVDYWVLTDDEAHNQCMDYLTDDDYLWKDAVSNGNTTDSLEVWAKWVINMDGYGHILNGYDGNEETTQINGTDYYVMRC